MKVIRPVTITEAMLVDSSVPEDDYDVYNAATDYAVDDFVIYGHFVYQSAQEPNIGNTPGLEPLYWSLIGPTNRWLMFDQEVSTQTTADESIVVTIAPGMVDSLALLDLVGAHVNVAATDGPGGPELYNREYPLDGSEVYDWYQYFYQPFIEIHEVVLTDLPLYGSAHITATLTGAGEVRIGSMVAGTVFGLGDTQYGASAGIIDYSRKQTSSTGRTSFAKRKYSKRLTAQLWLQNFNLDNIFRVLVDLRATPCVWVGTDAAGFALITIFGWYRDFNIDIAYPKASLCSLEVESLT